MLLPFPASENHHIELDYPIHTSVRHIHQPRFSRRRIIVFSSRDLVANPLTVDEFQRRPFLNRSRWLLKAWDSDIKEWRQFYLGSSAQHRSPGTLQLAIYKPHATAPCRVISRHFEPTLDDRRKLLKLICEVEREGKVPINCLRIIAPDMRLLA